jgi:hypothetical protein
MAFHLIACGAKSIGYSEDTSPRALIRVGGDCNKRVFQLLEKKTAYPKHHERRQFAPKLAVVARLSAGSRETYGWVTRMQPNTGERLNEFARLSGLQSNIPANDPYPLRS